LGLEEVIEEMCSVKRQIPFVGVFQVLDLIGVLETKPLEGKTPTLDPNPTLRSASVESIIKTIVEQVEFKFVDNWVSVLQDRKTKKFLREKLTPIQQQCFPAIFETLKEKEKNGELDTYPDAILRILSDLGEFEEKIPPEHVVEWLEEEELITVHEKARTGKTGKTVSTFSIEYSDKIWKGKPISFAQIVLWALFILIVVGAIAGKN